MYEVKQGIKKNMAHIVMLDSPKEDLFVCGNCKSIFTLLPLFLDHKRQTCPIVGVYNDERMPPMAGSTAYPDNASRNMADSSYPYQPALDVEPEKFTGGESSNMQSLEASCKLCDKSFKRSKSLTIHLKSHNGKPYQCLICGRCFVQSSHLKRHELAHKVWPNGLSETTAKSVEADTSSFCCMYCDNILSSYGQFRIHLKKHGALKKFKCIQLECHNLFDTMELLLKHVALDHKNAKYPCPLCYKNFCTLEDSAKHQQKHEAPIKVPNVRQFKCNLCDAKFKNKEQLELHMTTDNHIKTCIHCSKTLSSNKRLRLHLQIHKSNKEFKCSICSQSFSLKKYLTTHMVKHSNVRFTCSVCNKKFRRKDLLQRHLRTHQKKTMFCPFKEALGCKMEFTRSDKLKLHVKNHTKQMVPNPKKRRKTKGSQSSTIEIMIVPLEGQEEELSSNGM